jgi:hypothetical protein
MKKVETFALLQSHMQVGGWAAVRLGPSNEKGGRLGIKRKWLLGCAKGTRKVDALAWHYGCFGGAR